MRQILISVIVDDPDSERIFNEYMSEVTREIGDTMIGLGYPVRNVTVAHGPVIVDPRHINGQDMYDALRRKNQENNNADDSTEVAPAEG